MRRTLIVVLLVALGGAGLAAVLMLPAKARRIPPVEIPPVTVEVEPVRPLPRLEDVLSLPGVVEPDRVVKVAAEAAGRVERVACEEGKFYRAGTALIYLNDDLLRAEYDRAAAQADLDRKEYERIERLYKAGVPTEQQRDQAAARLAISRAGLAAAKARLDHTTVLMPIDGRLNDVPVEKGEYVQPGTPVAEVVDLRTAKVIIQVPEKDIHYITIGRAADIRARVRDREHHVRGRVSFVSELADERTRTTRVEIAVPNRERRLRSGQIVEVRLVRRVLSDVILVPLAAVIPLEDGKAVYVEQRGRAERRRVTLGLLRGLRVRVLSGLAAGDRLIVKGHRYVAPGQRVTVTQVHEPPAGKPDA